MIFPFSRHTFLLHLIYFTDGTLEEYGGQKQTITHALQKKPKKNKITCISKINNKIEQTFEPNNILKFCIYWQQENMRTLQQS